MSDSNLPAFPVILGTCLGHRVYRGFAPIYKIAEISRADIFDQEKNPNGTQRNLSRTHARKAYDYIATSERAFYPELVLNIRDSSYIEFNPTIEDSDFTYGVLRFVRDPRKSKSIVVSRMDGNHRLWFADGHEKGLPAIDRPVAFSFLVLGDLHQELEIFRDINDNQMGMNTSHLQNIAARLLGEKSLKVKDPPLYIVKRLQSDERSPFYNRINEGGAVKRGVTLGGLTIANLKNAIQDMLSRSAKLAQFPDTDAQYEVIKNYWLAVRSWIPDAWSNPTKYIVFKGVGLYAITYLGIEIIDRCLLKGKFTSEDMLDYLQKVPNKEVFLAKSGIPYAGRSGGRRIASDLIANLEEEGEISLAKLQKMILGDTP
jgi:DGQHR domain-containing protein